MFGAVTARSRTFLVRIREIARNNGRVGADTRDMSRITRDSFVDTLGAEGGKLDVNALGTQTDAALKRAGIDQAALREIAGEDGVISGSDEMAKLFDLVDTADRNRSYHSIDTTKRGADGKEVATASGALYDALKNEVERSRISQGSRPSPAPSGAPAGPLPNPEYRASQTAHARAVATLEARGFTDIHLAASTPYFNQADREWARHPYPKHPPSADSSRTLQRSGCAPVALAHGRRRPAGQRHHAGRGGGLCRGRKMERQRQGIWLGRPRHG